MYFLDTIEGVAKFCENEGQPHSCIHDIEKVTHLISNALYGHESRRDIWTDRDYLVHALAILTDSMTARDAALRKPPAVLPTYRHEDEWWKQYEESAAKLDAMPDTWAHLIADDIRTMVDGLRDFERKFDEASGADPAET